MIVALTIAGSDSGGGAGIQADLKTFQELGVFATTVITAVTAQNTRTILSIMPVSLQVIEDQLNAVLTDFDLAAIKTGMLFSAEIISLIAAQLPESIKKLVVDPVMISKAGESLLNHDALTAFKQQLLPKAYLLTPNTPEAETLTGIKITTEAEIQIAAEKLLQLGAQNVVIKGGHLTDPDNAKDYLFSDGKQYILTTPRIKTKNTHGTGCTFSAAITALLAKNYPLLDAVVEAKKFIQLAIQDDLKLGHGYGPTNHFAYQEHHQNYDVMITER